LDFLAYQKMKRVNLIGLLGGEEKLEHNLVGI
jgi:hypothetical protein